MVVLFGNIYITLENTNVYGYKSTISTGPCYHFPVRYLRQYQSGNLMGRWGLVASDHNHLDHLGSDEGSERPSGCLDDTNNEDEDSWLVVWNMFYFSIY